MKRFAQLGHKLLEGRRHDCLFYTPTMLSQAQDAQRYVILP